MPRPAVVGVDIGTSSSKAVLVGPDGDLLATAVRQQAVDRPAPGVVEMAAELRWDEFAALSLEPQAGDAVDVRAVGISGMGPCVLLADDHDRPLRPVILYGVDTRAGAQIGRLEQELDASEVPAMAMPCWRHRPWDRPRSMCETRSRRSSRRTPPRPPSTTFSKTCTAACTTDLPTSSTVSPPGMTGGDTAPAQ